MNSTGKAVANYLQAANALLQAGLEEMKAEDPQQLQDVVEAARAGAMFSIHTGLSTVGLFEVNISIVGASGETVNLMRLEPMVVNH
jgi:hypothetical protein